MDMNRKEIIFEIKGGKLTPPTQDDLERWNSDGGCEAACEHGCWVEPDGTCEHGRPSWLLYLGWI
jgi:hypothetical protein